MSDPNETNKFDYENKKVFYKKGGYHKLFVLAVFCEN